jgi:hypothetical protein
MRSRVCDKHGRDKKYTDPKKMCSENQKRKYHFGYGHRARIMLR